MLLASDQRVLLHSWPRGGGWPDLDDKHCAEDESERGHTGGGGAPACVGIKCFIALDCFRASVKRSRKDSTKLPKRPGGLRR